MNRESLCQFYTHRCHVTPSKTLPGNRFEPEPMVDIVMKCSHPESPCPPNTKTGNITCEGSLAKCVIPGMAPTQE